MYIAVQSAEKKNVLKKHFFLENNLKYTIHILQLTIKSNVLLKCLICNIFYPLLFCKY